MSKDRLVDVHLAAALLRTPARTLRSFLSAGRLRGIRSPYQWRIARHELERLIVVACDESGIQTRPLSLGALMTLKEVSTVLACSCRTTRLWADTRQIPAFKIGRSWRFWREDVETLKRKSQVA